MIVISAKIKLSVIVPVYNAEKYLSGCVDSLLQNQTKEFEIVLVDDGSSDGSRAICDAYASKYENIRVIHQDNGGAGSARNAGIAVARGRYLTFIDADDTLEAGYLDAAVRYMERDDDIVAFPYMTEYSQTGERHVKELREAASVGADEAVRLLEQSGMLNMPTNKLYKSALLSQEPMTVFLAGTEPGEDLIFNCECFMKAKKVSLINEAYYHWIRRGEDTLSNRFRDDLFERNRMFIDYRNRLYRTLGMEETDFALLSKGNLGYIFACVPNMYRKGHVFKKSRRMAFYRDILGSEEVACWVENAAVDYRLHQRFIKLYRSGSPGRMDVYYRTALWARNNFDGLWQNIRKRMSK
ncbi:MAG: glycosyltransferase [Ruminococcus sp.]|nr:glycosyltransferase [Ruminococcus sp.]